MAVARDVIGQEMKQWLAELRREALPLRRAIARLTAPDPSKLGHPLFSAMIKDRMRRWRDEGQPNPYQAIASKTGGEAYMRSLGYAVPEIYGVYPSLDEIPQFEDLPKNFVLKPTHGWSAVGVFLIRDGVDWLSGRRLTREELIHTARSLSRPGKYGIDGQWIAEELLINFDNPDRPAYDYKFFCFGPKVVAIHVRSRRNLRTSDDQHWVLDPHWKPLHDQLKWAWNPSCEVLPRPPFLDDMLKIASDVGGRLNIFIRIDMYATDRGPVFGEFTGYPSSAMGYTPRGDAWLGSHWKTRDGGIDVVA